MNKQELEQSLVIFTDGSSLGNPGPGGYGSLLVSSKLGEVIELGGSKPKTTNNEMELEAIVAALSYAAHNTETIHIFTDSSYAINGITKWMYGWQKNDWKKKDGGEIKNLFQFKTLFNLVQERGQKNIHFHHVAGHVGVPGNERVDDIARELAEGKDVELYRGTSAQYPITNILDVEVTDEDKAKKQHKKAKAYKYISMVDGVIQEHPDWEQTKQRVSGVKAQFKKATSKEHLEEIKRDFQQQGGSYE